MTLHFGLEPALGRDAGFSIPFKVLGSSTRGEWNEAYARDLGRLQSMARPQATTLEEVVRRLVAVYRPERVYLFGSSARGDVGPDSDLDVLVVVADDADEERCRSRLGYQALHGTGLAVDVVVCTRRYFDERQHLAASLPATVVREGRLLHAA